MAIQYVKPVRSFVASWSTSRVEIKTVHKVQAEASDTVEHVLAASGIPRDLEPLEWESLSMPFALCRNRDPQLSKKRPWLWYVESTFVWDRAPENKEPSQPSPTNTEGQPVSDPEAYAPTCRITYRSIDEAIEKAVFRGFFDQWFQPIQVLNTRMQPGDEMPMQNSAGIPIVPPLNRPVFFPALQIYQYRRKWEKWKDGDAVGKVNDTRSNLKIRELSHNLIDENFAVGEIYCAGREYSPVVVAGSAAWLVQTEIWIKEWLEHYEIDRGLVARAAPGDPDGFGGVVASGQSVDGVPLSRRIVGADGHTIDEPVLLNGEGQPLKDYAHPVYLGWEIFKKANFGLTLGPPFKTLP